jgi:hypothetical protein
MSLISARSISLDSTFKLFMYKDTCSLFSIINPHNYSTLYIFCIGNLEAAENGLMHLFWWVVSNPTKGQEICLGTSVSLFFIKLTVSCTSRNPKRLSHETFSVAGSGEMAQHRPAAGPGPPHTRAGGGGRGAEPHSQGAGHQGRQAQASGTHSYPTSFHNEQ